MNNIAAFIAYYTAELVLGFFILTVLTALALLIALVVGMFLSTTYMIFIWHYKNFRGFKMAGQEFIDYIWDKPKSKTERPLNMNDDSMDVDRYIVMNYMSNQKQGGGLKNGR